MIDRPRLSRPALLVLAAFAPGVASAQGPKAGPPAGLAEAQGEVDAALRALETSQEPDCVTLCRALSSLARATERLCNLTRGEPESTERRCGDARAKLKEATQRVRAACPECALAGQSPPSASVEPGAPKPADATDTMKAPPAPAPASGASFASSSEGGAGGEGLSATVGLGLARLALPPALFKVYGELSPGGRFTNAFALGAGRLPVEGGGRATVLAGELQPRFYALGRASRGGLFVGASLAYASTLKPRAGAGARVIDSRLLASGLSVGPVVGGKLVIAPGLTLEAHAGAGALVAAPSSETRKIIPLGDLSLGWTF